MEHLTLNNVKKIAVLRANALGDFIVILPALKALRDTYPQAQIVLLGKPWHHDFLKQKRTPVDRVILVPVKRGIRDENCEDDDEESFASFFKLMQEENFDIAISFQGNGISANPFINRLGAKVTLGTTCSKAEKIDRSIPFFYYQHEVLRYLEIVGLVGATTNQVEPRLAILPEDESEINELLSYLENKIYVVINPVANDQRRMWPCENYIAVGNELRDKNIKIVFTGSKADSHTVDLIISEMSHPAINACGISFGALAALCSKASLTISPDTGPLHVAQAVQCPTVGIYWAPNVINWAPLNRAIHRPIISWKMQCPYCGIIPNTPYPFEPITECQHNVSFVSDVTVQDVLQAVDELLDQHQLEVSLSQ